MNKEHYPSSNPLWLPERIISLFSSSLRECVISIPKHLQVQIEEIRLRSGLPVIVRTFNDELFLTDRGVTTSKSNAYICRERDIQVLVNQTSGGALYSLEEELKNGFVTIPGGHRLGFTGRVIVEGGVVKTLRDLTGVNVRFARQVKDCASRVIPYITSHGNLPWNTLIISPPQCGKTTLLRDIVRTISGDTRGVQVGVVDERSEIAGCYKGLPQLELGLRTDVLDGCPKAQGMIMLVRSMSPQVIATDEIGRAEDVYAILEMLNAGVRVVTTVHGSSLDEISKRPQLGQLIKDVVFQRYIIMGRSLGVGTVEQILDETGKNILAVPIRLCREVTAGD